MIGLPMSLVDTEEDSNEMDVGVSRRPIKVWV